MGGYKMFKIIGSLFHVAWIGIFRNLDIFIAWCEHQKLAFKYGGSKNIPIEEYVKQLTFSATDEDYLYGDMMLIAAIQDVSDLLGLTYNKTMVYGLMTNYHGNHFNPFTDADHIDAAKLLLEVYPNKRNAVVETMCSYDKVNVVALNNKMQEKFGISLKEWVEQDPFSNRNKNNKE